MKVCRKCGAAISDIAQFCPNCRGSEFEPMPADFVPHQQVQPAPNAIRPKEKKPLEICDMFCLLGFVASLMGIFAAAMILHPLAAIASFFAFRRNTRFKGLAIAGFVISVVGGVIFILISLYRAGAIPEWLIDGTFR